MDSEEHATHYGQRLEEALETIETSGDREAIRRERHWLLNSRSELLELRLATGRELNRAHTIACKRVSELVAPEGEP